MASRKRPRNLFDDGRLTLVQADEVLVLFTKAYLRRKSAAVCAALRERCWTEARRNVARAAASAGGMAALGWPGWHDCLIVPTIIIFTRPAG